MRFLKFAKQAFPNTHLVVGVIGDKAMMGIMSSTVLSCAERAEVVRSCKYVDEVVEDCPAVLGPDFVERLRLDYFGCSEDSSSEAALDLHGCLHLQSK